MCLNTTCFEYNIEQKTPLLICFSSKRESERQRETVPASCRSANNSMLNRIIFCIPSFTKNFTIN